MTLSGLATSDYNSRASTQREEEEMMRRCAKQKVRETYSGKKMYYPQHEYVHPLSPRQVCMSCETG